MCAFASQPKVVNPGLSIPRCDASCVCSQLEHCQSRDFEQVMVRVHNHGARLSAPRGALCTRAKGCHMLPSVVPEHHACASVSRRSHIYVKRHSHTRARAFTLLNPRAQLEPLPVGIKTGTAKPASISGR